MNLIRRSRNLPGSRRDDLSSFLDDFFNSSSTSFPTKVESQLQSFSPAVNLKEDEGHYYLEAELAGLSKNDVDITIKDHTIHLKGEKKSFKEDKKEDYHRIERTFGSFHRAIPLGTDADDEKITANFVDGLLTVTVGKFNGPERGHRKIEIA